MQIRPDFETFAKRAEEGNLIPVWSEILADTETTISTFRKLAADSEYGFLLESVEQGENLGRYSFIGTRPQILIRGRGDRVEVTKSLSDGPDVTTGVNPMDFLRDFMQRYKVVRDPALEEVPYLGGAVGYMAYDLVRTFERLPERNPDDLNLPDMYFMIADTLAIFDHVRHRTILLTNAHVTDGPRAAYDEAVRKIERMADRLRSPWVRPTAAELDVATDEPQPGDGELRSNFTREEFAERVEAIKEYIRAGDAFQVVFSQRFSRAYHGEPFDIYRALRAINPSPYMFFLKFGDVQLAGSSPEILVRVHDGDVTVRPLAGTRKRGATKPEDQALERELLADPKERAEHIMLVDLGRNDVGRVSAPGSVHVSDLMTIERYSHVMHIVSNVAGKLAPGKDAFDALAATFPAGTLSGAPKIRAMEIIDEMENVRRGPYGGAVGYFSFDSNLDSCIILRTCLIKNRRVYIQAGAGIVADSVPEAEYQETVNKAMAVVKAVELAEEGLD